MLHSLITFKDYSSRGVCFILFHGCLSLFSASLFVCTFHKEKRKEKEEKEAEESNTAYNIKTV